MYACIYAHTCYALLKLLEFGGSGSGNNSITQSDRPTAFIQNLFSVAALPLLAHSLARQQSPL